MSAPDAGAGAGAGVGAEPADGAVPGRAPGDRGAGARPSSPRSTTAEAVVALLLFGAVAYAFLSSKPRGGGAPTEPAAVLMFALLAGSYLALSVGAVRHALRAALPSPWPRATIGPAVLLAASISYAAAVGLPATTRALAYALYLAVPVVVLTAGRRAAVEDDAEGAPVREFAAVALLWLPIEFRLLPPLPVPAPGGYDGVHLLAVVAGLYLFLVARGLSRVGFTWLVRGKEWGLALAAFLAFTIVALPIGFATGFIRWNPHPTLANVLLRPVLTLLVTGVPEEFLFRGVIQNLLQRRLRAGAALATASVIFGLAHFPDPRYMLLATLAGVAYGWVYQRTGKITAAAITHALVDAVWVTLLRR